MNATVRLPQSLRLRLVTGFGVGALVVLGVFLLDATAVAAVAGAFALAGGWEWSRLAGLHRPSARIGYLLALTAIGLVLWNAGPPALRIVLGIAALWWFAVAIWLASGARVPQGAATPVAQGALLALGVLCLCALMLAVAEIVSAPGAARGVLLYAVCLVWAADTGAYFAGRRYGRHALAPRISAGKTWEGFAGGLASILLYALVGAWLLEVPAATLPGWVGLALVAGAVSVAGDLFISLLKRAAGVKDSGKLLPGHGGMLDRIDSLLAAIPIMALGLLALPIGALS